MAVLKAYGDTRDDGMVQVSFTLPRSCDAVSNEVGRIFAARMGLKDIRVACAKPAGEQFTFYVVYGRADAAIDIESLPKAAERPPRMSREEVNEYLKANFGRKVVVVGACIGTDAHSVGIDAIMNMKGFAGDYGLERYEMFEAHNIGAQISPEDLARKAEELRADAILVSQVVTQKNVHVLQLTRLVDLIEAEGLREKVLLIVGGPYIDDKLTQELGYDAGFGRGTLPSDVATYIARKLVSRL